MKETQPTSIRIEESIMERIRADAIKDKRSVTAQIEYMLEKYYETFDNFVKAPHNK